MIFVILSPILLKINNNNLEQEINKALEVSASNFDEEEELEKSFKILNAISENVKTKEEKNVREVQEQKNREFNSATYIISYNSNTYE